MARLHPGVYIEEVSSGVQPIEGVSTSNAAFIGKAEKGTLGVAQLITSVPDFQTQYGSYLNDSFLAQSVFNFFNNGGKKTYVIRVAGAGATPASIAINDRKGDETLVVQALNEGAWGNDLSLVVTDSPSDPNNAFTLQVLQDRSTLNPPLPPLLLETMDGMVMDPKSANYVVSVVTTKSQYISVTADSGNLTTGSTGSSQGTVLPVGDGSAVLHLGTANGGTEAVGTATTAGTSVSTAAASTNPAADQRSFTINLNGDGPKEVVIGPGPATGLDIAKAIQDAVRALFPNIPANQAAYSQFTCTFTTTYNLTSGTIGTTSSVVVTASTTGAVSLTSTLGFMITVNGDGPHLVTVGPASGGDAIAGAIKTAVSAISPNRSVNKPAFLGFIAKYDKSNDAAAPSLLLTSGVGGTSSSVVVANSPGTNAAGTLGLGLSNGGSEIVGAAVLRPANSAQPNTQYHLGAATVGGNVKSVVLGADGSLPGDLEHKNGLTALDTINDVNIVCIPGISSADVVSTGTNYCAQRGDCFFIGDSNSTDDTVDEARTFVNSLTVKSSYGAVYYPWLQIADPTGVSPSPIASPPSGFVAGMYAQIDAKRGVWKAPSGTEANLGGAVGLIADTTDAQQDFLNPIGVNVIRSFPSSGIVIWGARTLATLSDPEYRYVPVRRTAIFLEQSIYNGIQYAVFEPNDSGLWSSLRLNVGAFMMQQYRAGAFQGSSPNDAFFVRVDATTTTQQDIDSGTVNILVGFAALKPAEFVVLKLTQKAGQSAV